MNTLKVDKAIAKMVKMVRVELEGENEEMATDFA